MRAAPGALSGLFADRYEIERVLGEGATATVHLARDTRAGEAVAIKVLRPELTESAAKGRFSKEIQRTASLSHPRILPVLDSGDRQGQLYLVLPYMEGGTLRDRLRKERQLPVDDALAIIRPIAEALDYAHAQGLIHRDVKPENILFSSGEAHLGDFGIARALESVLSDTITSTGIVRGTPAYLSPEQASGSRDLDGRSDQYSLACVLYEMLAGVPAFVGPTPESVIAQRFTHAPRDIRAYRPSISAGVQTVISRVMAITPADRYRTAIEFVDALEQALQRSVETGGTLVPAKRWWRTPRTIAAGGLALLALGSILVARRAIDSESGERALDTTRVVVLPLESSLQPAQPWRDDDLLQQAVTRWRGITVVDQFQVADAVRRFGPIRTSRDARRVAEALGAGRYIRGTLSRLGDDRRASLSLYDVAADQPLHHVAMVIPPSLDGAVSAFATLADSLLLRSAAPDSGPIGSGSRSLPAVQALGKAQLALESWDLAAADSGFQAALAADPSYVRASLWLAQVRAWRERQSPAWRVLAERAAASPSELNARERRLAMALVHLASHRYEQACSLYDDLRRRNDRDFAAWFGLGQCQSLNRLVVPDARSPSGWRMLGNMSRAVHAYAKALAILPSVHRGYERGAFDRLKRGLLLSPDVLVAYGANDSAVFYARPGLIGDSLVVVPYPWTTLAAGGRSSVPPRYDEARRSLRAEFRRIAAGWSSAFPESPGAKEAVALSLDLLGDVAAIDTLRRARALTNDPARGLQLMVEEVFLLVKYGISRDTSLVRKGTVLADSAIRLGLQSPTQENAHALLPVAALTGRCTEADSLSGLSATTEVGRIPPQLVALSYRVLFRATLECAGQNGASVADIASAIARQFPPGPDRDLADAALMLRPAIVSTTGDTAVLSRLHGPVHSALVSAADHIAHNRPVPARAVLDSVDRDPSPPTVDMALVQGRLWLKVADTVRALRVLDVSLAGVAETDPSTWDEPGRAAALTATLILRADISRAQHDVRTTRLWAAVAAILLEQSKSMAATKQRMVQHLAAYR